MEIIEILTLLATVIGIVPIIQKFIYPKIKKYINMRKKKEKKETQNIIQPFDSDDGLWIPLDEYIEKKNKGYF